MVTTNRPGGNTGTCVIHFIQELQSIVPPMDLSPKLTISGVISTDSSVVFSIVLGIVLAAGCGGMLRYSRCNKRGAVRACLFGVNTIGLVLNGRLVDAKAPVLDIIDRDDLFFVPQASRTGIPLLRPGQGTAHVPRELVGKHFGQLESRLGCSSVPRARGS